jgi:hypothetical protein
MKAEAPAVTPSARSICAVCGARLDPVHLEAGPNGGVCCFCGAPQRRPGVPDLRLVPHDAPASKGLDVLRHARLARGETLEQAARFTCIGLSYLRALEDGDIATLDMHPGRVYARFFLREYAEHLGLESGALLRQFDHDAEPALLPVPLAPTWKRSPRAWRWALGAFLVLIALLSADAVFSFGSSDDPTVPVAVVTPTVVENRQPKPTPVVAPPARPDGLRVVIRTTEPSWILAVVDGSTKLEETLPAGKAVVFTPSDRIDLRFGNAGGVDLTVSGRAIQTGTSANVVDLSFAWRDGHVVRL